MRVSTAISAAAFAAILGSGLYFVSRDGRAPAPEDAEARESQGPLRNGRWYLSRGDLDRAAEEFAKALADPREMIEARQGIRSVIEAWKEPSDGDVARLTKLIAWLDAYALVADAESVAEQVVRLDPENRTARLRLGHEEYEGVWYEPDMLDLIRVAQARQQECERIARMTPREQQVQILIDDFGRRFGRPIEFRDGAPDSPWFLMMEESQGRLAALVLADFDRVLDDLFAEFSRRFGDVFAVSKAFEKRPFPVFVFSTRERYLENTGASRLFTSHVDRTSNTAYMARDDEEMYEVVIHAATWLLVEELLNFAREPRSADPDSYWLNAGLACLFEAWSQDSEGRIRFKGLAPGRLPYAKRALRAAKRRTMTDVLSLRAFELARIQYSREAAQELEAECWSLVYFLWEAGEGARRGRFKELCRAIVEGRPPVSAAKKVFGDLNVLDKEWRDFILSIK